MSTHLSRFFRQRRLDLGLRPGQVAARVGGRLCKTATRICLFEECGDIEPRLFPKLQAALGITDAEVEEQFEKDRREHFAAWLEWVNEPIAPQLIVRVIPGVFAEHQLPEGLTSLEQTEEYAAAFAKRHHKMIWLCPGTRKFTVRFDQEGNKIAVIEASPDRAATPWMRLAGGLKKFLLGWQGDGINGAKMLDRPEPPRTSLPPAEAQ